MKTQVRAICVLLITVILLEPFVTRADEMDDGAGNCIVPRTCFGGLVTKKKIRLCLIRGPLGIPVPNPAYPAFWYFEVQQLEPPVLHKLYYVYLISQSRILERREKEVWVLGDYTPGTAGPLIEVCTWNRNSLRRDGAFGIISQIGTGCKPGEIPKPLKEVKCVGVRR